MKPSPQVPVISTTAIDHFNRDGFLRISGSIPAALLTKLRLVFDELCDPANPVRQRTTNTHNGREYTNNIDHICITGGWPVLELMGLPAVYQVAEALCNAPCFPVQDFAVVKMLGDRTPVLWHQDMLHQRRGSAITMGIYLDAAPAGDGALRVIAGSHKSGKDICTLIKEPFTENDMQPGDILVHDMMVAHASEPLVQQPIRRVLYFEWLTEAMVYEESAYPEAVMYKRQALLHLAQQYHSALLDGQEESVKTTIQEKLATIYETPVHGKPSTYCIEKVERTVPPA